MVTIQELRARSKRATCGAFERETIVSSQNVAEAIRLIKSKGFTFVGRGPAGFGKTKLWYVPSGAALL